MREPPGHRHRSADQRTGRRLAACLGVAVVAYLAATSLHQPPTSPYAANVNVMRRGAEAAAIAAAGGHTRTVLTPRGTAAVAASRAVRRRPLVVRFVAPAPVRVDASAATWAGSPFAIRVANCESGGGRGDLSPVYDGQPHLRDANGHYGKWQFALSTWWSVGGTGNPADASVAEQDYRAWLLWKRDGWAPWQCAQ
jgi:hypothetical protein